LVVDAVAVVRQGDAIIEGRVDSKRSDSNVTSWVFTYTEDGHRWHLDWDWRETQGVACALLEVWDVPEGKPIDAAARERILDAVWPVVSVDGAANTILDESRRLRCPVVARWKRGEGGFLIDVHDGGHVDYLELGRTMRLRYREPETYLAMIDWPAVPRWTEPDAPVAPEAIARIQERLQFHRPDDVRIGGHLPWRFRLGAGG
jgi:hypothetical protein